MPGKPKSPTEPKDPLPPESKDQVPPELQGQPLPQPKDPLPDLSWLRQLEEPTALLKPEEVARRAKASQAAQAREARRTAKELRLAVIREEQSTGRKAGWLDRVNKRLCDLGHEPISRPTFYRLKKLL